MAQKAEQKHHLKAKKLQVDGEEMPKMKYNKVETSTERWSWNERREEWFRREKKTSTNEL